MKVAFLVVTFLHTVLCGRTSSLLSPAGVTYVDGSYHAGLAAGPVGYSASAAAAPVSTVTASPAVYASAAAVPATSVAAVSAAPAAYAAAPVAGVSTGSSVYASAPSVAAAQSVYASAPAVYAAAPAVATAPAIYASAAPVTKYAAVPTVQHVPAVADVPVTRINAQPGVIQKTLDVARPAVKTQRFEVRRPAIQKQFYDIEERVVVRPAGSAVVELDQPLSRTQKGPSVIRPTGGAVTLSSSESIALPTGPDVSGISTGPTPVSPVDYSLRETGSGALPPAPPTAQAPVISAPVYSGQTSAVFPPATPVHSAAVAAPIHSVAVSAPAQTVAITAPTGVSTVSAGSSGLHSISASSSGHAFSTPAPQYSDDSVTIQSAAFSSPRSGYRVQAHQAGAYQPVEIPSNDFHTASPQTYSAPVAVPQTYSAPVFPSRQTIFKSAVPTTRFSSPVSSSPVRDDSVATYTASSHFLPHQKVRIPSTYSDDSAQSHINHENQQKLIQLLTARGGVTEIGFGRSGAASASYPVDAGEVRGRVISATPAPAYAAPTNERVNTRRVVVSRPIETLQEVEVAEPVTKYERVHVSQPTVIKTASQDVVRVPTSVPVYGKALAPVAEESYATLSSEWQ